MLPWIYVPNIARCSIAWSAQTPIPQIPVLRQKKSRAVQKQIQYFTSTKYVIFEYFSLRSQTFYPNYEIKWPGSIGAPRIPDKGVILFLSVKNSKSFLEIRTQRIKGYLIWRVVYFTNPPPLLRYQISLTLLSPMRCLAVVNAPTWVLC